MQTWFIDTGTAKNKLQTKWTLQVQKGCKNVILECERRYIEILRPKCPKL